MPITSGPIPANIAIVTDWPDSIGFIKSSLTKLGINADTVFITHILTEKPPKGIDGQPDIDAWISERKTCPGPGWVKYAKCWVEPRVHEGMQAVVRELGEVAPKLVITLGKPGLVALCDEIAVDSWHGSRLSPPGFSFTVVPMFHPRRLIRADADAFILRLAVKRAVNILLGKQLPRHYAFEIEPDFHQVCASLRGLLQLAENSNPQNPLKLSGDLETRAGHIACFGIAWSPVNAICIPHLRAGGDNPFYWPEEEEAILIALYAQLFAHPNILWIGQNFSYDCQYFERHWGIRPNRVRDTMIGHHALHSNIRKGLDFLSFLYAQDHVYWKDEIKEWDETIGEKQYWTYNCKDACITYECDTEIQALTAARPQHSEFQQSLFFPVHRMMQRGIKTDVAKRKIFSQQLTFAALDKQEQLNWVVGHELNAKSPKQLLSFFYQDLGIPGIRALGKETLSTNSPTLAIIADKHPVLQPVCRLITELRSIGVFLSTFIDAGLDIDNRMRSAFAIAGPTTYRFNSRENAFGSGMNFQNIPITTKVKIKDPDYIKLPNIRELFVPDKDHTFFDIDLDRADMQIVGRESGDKNLQEALARGVDLHCFSATEVFNIRGIPFDELIETHPNYPEHRAKIGKANRDKCKNGGHACDYGVGDFKLAQTLGITRNEAAIFKAKWFGLFPGIRAWHLRTERELATQGYIENKFGARLYSFGRINLPEFLGWMPQSTVAGVINRALVAIDSAEQQGEVDIQVLIQVHDSLAGQFPTAKKAESIAALKRLASIVVPYENPLIIPVGVKTSLESWGAVK